MEILKNIFPVAKLVKPGKVFTDNFSCFFCNANCKIWSVYGFKR